MEKPLKFFIDVLVSNGTFNRQRLREEFKQTLDGSLKFFLDGIESCCVGVEGRTERGEYRDMVIVIFVRMPCELSPKAVSVLCSFL